MKHILVYFSNTSDATFFYDCLQQLNKNDHIKSFCYHTGISKKEREINISDFQRFEVGVHKIILSVDQLTEGANLVICDCVMFAEPKTAEAEIVQCIGRALRNHTDKTTGYKKERAFVIIPTWLHKGENEHETFSSKYKTIREINDKMKSESNLMYKRNFVKNKQECGVKITVSRENNDVIKSLVVSDFIASSHTISDCFTTQLHNNDIANITYKQFEELISKEKIRTMKALGAFVKQNVLCKLPHQEFSMDFISYSKFFEISILSYNEAVTFLQTLKTNL
jgi:predicted helicase